MDRISQTHRLGIDGPLTFAVYCMSATLQCPQCGAVLADTQSIGDLCPVCLLSDGLDETTSGDLTGLTFAQYRVIRKIGRGGMGEVYLAEDTKLERKVALKFLPQQMQHDAAAQIRFTREARSAAALDHPFICKIYETGEAGELTYIAQEFIDGETLEGRLKRGTLSPSEMMAVIEEIADAMAEAHRCGIVHRDIKPSNIMLTHGGHVKVMDLGLAKRFSKAEEKSSPAESQLVTRAHMVLGSLPYMSPEQARGDSVDARSDVFSLGTLFYEITTGRRPHHGPTPAVLFDQILNLRPAGPESLNPEAPAGIGAVIMRALEKDPDLRYQSAGDLLADLRRVRGGEAPAEDRSKIETGPEPPSGRFPRLLAGAAVLIALLALVALIWRMVVEAPPPSPTSLPPQPLAERPTSPALAPVTSGPLRLAVLPFRKLTPLDKRIENISLALVENIIIKLTTGAMEQIYVPPAATIAKYANEPERDVSAIARELSADRVLDLSLQQVGEEVTVTFQLVDPATLQARWSRQMVRPVDKIGEIFQGLPELLTTGLSLRVDAKAEQRLVYIGTTNADAEYEYLQGRQLLTLRMWEIEGMELARSHLEKALGHDSDFSLACSSLAMVINIQRELGMIGPGGEVEKALLEKAIDLDPLNSEALASLSWLHEKKGRSEEAYHMAIQGLELSPNNERNLHSLGILYQNFGLVEECLAVVDRIRDLNPHYPYVHTQEPYLHFLFGRNEEAAPFGEQRIKNDPNNLAFVAMVAVIRIGLQDLAGARDLLPQLSLPGYTESVRFLIDCVEHPEDDHQPTDAAVDFAEKHTRRDYSYYLAYGYAVSGRAAEALEWCRKASVKAAPNRVMYEAPRFFDPIREDPEYKAFLAEMGERNTALLAKIQPVYVPKKR